MVALRETVTKQQKHLLTSYSSAPYIDGYTIVQIYAAEEQQENVIQEMYYYSKYLEAKEKGEVPDLEAYAL